MWIDFLRLHAQRIPQHPALIFDESGETLTYTDLDRQASQWAAQLHREGVGKGDRVAYLGPNCLHHLTLFFGCAKLGAIFVPLNLRLADSELATQLDWIEPKRFYGSGGRLGCREPHDFSESAPLEYPETEIHMDDVLMILFTSGSTGEPKGVMLHAGMLLWNAINTCMDWGLFPSDRSVLQMPFFHTGGYNVICLPLLRLGGTLVMCNGFDPDQTLAVIQRHRITVYFAVPTMFRMMQEAPSFARSDFSTVRACISGGAPIPASLIAAYRDQGVPLKQGFGLTEVGPNCFTMTDEEALSRPDSVGRPMPHSAMRLVDEAGQPVKRGEVGELAIKGPHVCKGYWGSAALFAQSFRDGFFHTGDLMRQDEEGFFYVAGRRKDMYISGGENVYPGEVMRQLVQHPRVLDAVVLPVADEKWGEVGAAFLRTQTPLTLDELRRFLDDRLSRYKHPHYLFCLDNFPLLPNNKVDMKALAAMAAERLGRNA